MKKILALSLIALSVTSMAHAGALATHTVSAANAKIFGGTTAADAAASTSSLIRLSTGVSAAVNFTKDTATNLTPSYAIFTKHYKGSKVFGTANDSTNVYWKASPAAVLTADELGTGEDNANFGTGWTAH